MNDWNEFLSEEKSKPYFVTLNEFLQSERKSKIIFPAEADVFNAFTLTPWQKVKVVILGQDPYHGASQAHGLAFSVQRGVKPPPSLQNIYKELMTDLGINPPAHGNLEAWAREGVLLINAVLTVEEGKPASHHGKGWEQFTDQVIEKLNKEKDNLVFILWGAPAQKKASKVNSERHLIISSPHPSPLSSYRGFFGSKPFSQANTYLASKKIGPINWKLD